MSTGTRTGACTRWRSSSAHPANRVGRVDLEGRGSASQKIGLPPRARPWTPSRCTSTRGPAHRPPLEQGLRCSARAVSAVIACLAPDMALGSLQFIALCLPEHPRLQHRQRCLDVRPGGRRHERDRSRDGRPPGPPAPCCWGRQPGSGATDGVGIVGAPFRRLENRGVGRVRRNEANDRSDRTRRPDRADATRDACGANRPRRPHLPIRGYGRCTGILPTELLSGQ
jgi:hypothetical protein